MAVLPHPFIPLDHVKCAAAALIAKPVPGKPFAHQGQGRPIGGAMDNVLLSYERAEKLYQDSSAYRHVPAEQLGAADAEEL